MISFPRIELLLHYSSKYRLSNIQARLLWTPEVREMEKPMPVLLKPVEFAMLTNQSKSSVYNGLATGAIPHVRVNGLLRIPRAFVDRLIAQALSECDPR
jgi:hypothetical protein